MVSLKLSFSEAPILELVETRFSHPLLGEKEKWAVRGQEEGCFRWTQGPRAACLLLVKWAAWRYDKDSPQPRFEGVRPCPATTLNDVLSKRQAKWLSDVFGKDTFRDPVFLKLVKWQNRDLKNNPEGPVRFWLDVEQLPPTHIEVVVDGRQLRDAEGLRALARRLEAQYWSRARKKRDEVSEDETGKAETGRSPQLAGAAAQGSIGIESTDVLGLGPRNVPSVPSLFIGRGEALSELKRRFARELEGAEAAYVQRVVVMRGWPGVGKSTVATALAHDDQVLQTYRDGAFWASLGQEPELIAELASWGRMLGSDAVMTARSTREASGLLRELFSDMRALLIVDDVWEAGHAEAFRVGGAKCAMLLTTRLPAVAEAVAPTPEDTYVLPVLCDDDSLRLLAALAPAVVDEHAHECRDLARELEGLPLALQVAGRMLNIEAQMGWGVSELLREVRDDARLLQVNAPPDCADLLSETTPTVAALLRKSTDRLEARSRECFAMLGAFAPKPATFDLDAMGAVWEMEDPRPIVRELAGRGLLEPAGECRFWMHALLVRLSQTLLTG